LFSRGSASFQISDFFHFLINSFKTKKMMKKIYIGVFAISAAFTINAQSTIDFESTSLTPNLYNNGSDLSGGFLYNDVHFYNYYDTTYYYNTGFSISNQVDNTTAGWGNQYSAITAGGFNSSNYAIFYPYGNIDLSSTPRILESMRITNSTFAALSMRDGDFVGKKFGSPNGADGNPDGTNGEDFLKLIVSSINLAGDTIGSLDYYLADFRFADSTQDYILDEWDLLDLSTLNSANESIAYLVFDFESSDVGQFGINTPTYFAMDDFKFTNGTIGLIENDLSKEWFAYPNPTKDIIQVKGINGHVRVFDISGNEVLYFESTDNAIDLQDLTSGVYLLSIQNENEMFTKRILKL